MEKRHKPGFAGLSFSIIEPLAELQR